MLTQHLNEQEGNIIFIEEHYSINITHLLYLSPNENARSEENDT